MRSIFRKLFPCFNPSSCSQQSQPCSCRSARLADLLQQNTGSIDELRDIASDLVKAGVMSAANDERHDAMFTDLKGRLDRLENRR